MATAKLFISHAASDKSLVKAFVDLIEGGIGVHPSEIFCSSLKGQGIKPGVDFKASIREHLDGATCVIALISENFYGSAFCMCELGGVWLQSKSFIPVLVPPLESVGLKAVLAGLQALKIGDKADLDEFRDEIAERLSITALPTPRWNERRDEFLDSLSGILAQLPSTTPIARVTHNRVLKELEEYKTEFQKSEAEIQRLQAINADLAKLKDAPKAAAVIRKHSSSIQVFENLVRAAKEALRPLPTNVVVALYYRTRGEEYYPNWREEGDDIKYRIERGQLILNGEESVSPCDSDPKIRKAIAALDELESWLEEPPMDFFEWYEATFEGTPLDMQLRPFWEKHL
jgi:hypothetical protein